jgi:acyl-CoA thioesterase I
MCFSHALLRAGTFGILGLLVGCNTPSTPPTPTRVSGESFIVVGEEPAALAYLPARGEPLRLRNTYAPSPGSINYEEGRDYTTDYARGTVTRLPGSRLPDFRTHVLYGQLAFDHTKFSHSSNQAFFVFADYTPAALVFWPIQTSQADRLRATRAKLLAGAPVTLVAFGDSITAGGEASAPRLIFWQRWADHLQEKYPQARINAINAATGGDNTTRGLQRLSGKVLAAHPDLVLIAFGMNDHNQRGVPVADFASQLRSMIARIRAATTAEIILLSTFPPNPQWLHSSHRMAEYAAATADVAAATGCAYADVFNNWQAMAARKRPEDFLANNINHPNDFGHEIYYRVLAALGL